MAHTAVLPFLTPTRAAFEVNPRPVWQRVGPTGPRVHAKPGPSPLRRQGQGGGPGRQPLCQPSPTCNPPLSPMLRPVPPSSPPAACAETADDAAGASELVAVHDRGRQHSAGHARKQRVCAGHGHWPAA